ncbi:AfsR/SARP family transcriptional regulator [Saccharopolyspora shandongensis]|uniref:AfsR/SARP family transcriptional regulator n=1 Tax=Saccharopolyspora shandongensis TaxID=418495 RepID=UPI0033EB25AE
MQSLEINVLGPLTVRLRSASIVPTAGKPRQILALLALRCGRVVPVSTLMEEVWGDAIPRSGATTLQTYVLQLRRLIAESLPSDSPWTAKDLLATSYNGYQLTATPCSFDLVEFNRLAVSGDAALEKCDPAAASKFLAQAMDLWRGQALMDVPMGRMLAMEVIGIEEARARVHQQRIIADLYLGKHAMLIPELRKLVAENPTDENISALLMIAFQRSGSAPRALQVFRDLRQALIRELGVEPSGRLQKLHQALLSNAADIPLRSIFSSEQRLAETV